MALENQQIHTINTDKIFLNNRNDKKTDHIVFETNGVLGENNVEFSNCNVDVKTGFLKAPEIRSNNLKDADGNTTMTLSSSAIDFHSKTINNFSFSSGSISATSVSSANGFASLDAELDSLQSQKVSITGHTANKVFVSSSGGGLTTSSVTTTDLNKLPNITISAPVNLNQNQTDTTASKAITDLITITGGVNLDDIKSQQTTNTSAIGINTGARISNTSLIQTNISSISTIQADVATNVTAIGLNTAKTGITSTEQTKLGHISVSQAVNLDTMESDIADNISNLTQRRIEILANQSNIATNTYKLTGVSYSGLSTAGTYEIEAGNFGGVSSVYSNGDVTVIGGYDGVNSSGNVILKQNNTERLKITNSDTSIGSGNNKLIVDSAYAALSTPGMEFLSDAFFLLKKTSSTSHWNLIMDRLGDYWSGFRSSHHWDTYYDSDKYNVNATGTTMYLQYYSLGNISLCHRGGFVGIGGNPSYPLHIVAQGSSSSTHAHYGIYQSPGSYMDAGQFNRIGIGATNGYYTNTYIAMKVDYGIWTSTLTTSSDRRIKTNIRDVPDDLSLKQLRELPCVYYDYIDYQKKGDSSTIGFIAQDVKKVMPMAVSLKKEFIPNEMRNLIEPVWETITDEKGNEKFKLTINDLDVSGNTSEAVVKPTKFRFYVNNGDNEKKLEIENLENEPKSFIFEEKWKNIFLYGKEVDDFHIIEKDKIFAMLFSATQEIDKIQQQHAIEIANIKAELQKEKNKTIYFEDKLHDIEETLKSLTN